MSFSKLLKVNDCISPPDLFQTTLKLIERFLLAAEAVSQAIIALSRLIAYYTVDLRCFPHAVPLLVRDTFCNSPYFHF